MARSTASLKDPYQLPPMRAEKRIVPLPVDISRMAFEGRSGGAQGDYHRADMTKDLTPDDYLQTQAISTRDLAAGLTDFIYVRLLDRGPDGSDLTFRFLINPDSISASRQVIDAESLTRAGLQTGIWGDLLDITASGSTGGQYFAGGLVDGHSEYSLVDRNLQQLITIYENNGCWFEGESGLDPGWGSDVSLKQLGSQADVTLVFGNFVWSGCFTELSIDETADNPYYNKFSFSFMAWKERFKDDSPWINSIRNDQYFGHAYELYRRKKKGTNSTLYANDEEAAASGRMLFTSPTDEVRPSDVPAFQRKLL